MGREVNVSTFAGNDHNRWLNANAVDYGSDPLDLLIRKEDRGEVIPITGVRAWPYPGQDMEREPFPQGETQSLYVGPCQCCGGNRNPRRWCAVCAPKTPGVKAKAKEPVKKYVKDAGGMRGGIGA